MNPLYYKDFKTEADSSSDDEKTDNPDGLEYVKAWDCTGLQKYKCYCINLFGCDCSEASSKRDCSTKITFKSKSTNLVDNKT